MLNWWLKPPRVTILAVLWALIILILSALPGRDLPRVDIVHVDKFAHLLVYAILSLLLYLSIVPYHFKGTGVLAIFLSSLYGVAMEFMQDTFFPERFFDWADAGANFVGACIGIVIIRRFI